MAAPDPQALVRRGVLAVAALLFLTLALHTTWHVQTILGWEPLLSATKLAASGISLLAGVLTAVLLILDFNGRPAPMVDTLKPAWLVVGLDLIHSYYRHDVLWLLIPGIGALLMGISGSMALVRRLRAGRA
jgi:hypothetical protein